MCLCSGSLRLPSSSNSNTTLAMASVAEARRSPFAPDLHNANLHKSIPILPSSSSTLAPPRDPMDITPTPPSTMGPPALNCASFERNGTASSQSQSQSQSHSQTANGDSGNTSPNGSAPAVGAAAAAQQPKVVQTAFIHKLYKCAHPRHTRARKHNG